MLMYSCLMWTGDGFVVPGGDVQMNTPIAAVVVITGKLKAH